MLGYDVAEDPRRSRATAHRVVHTSTLYLIRQQVELAEKIARLSGIPDARVFFTNSGTEANEAALLVATSTGAATRSSRYATATTAGTFATIGITGNRPGRSSS